jgi:hypothetical protein
MGQHVPRVAASSHPVTRAVTAPDSDSGDGADHFGVVLLAVGGEVNAIVGEAVARAFAQSIR